MDAADLATEYLESAMELAAVSRERRREELARQSQGCGGRCVQCLEKIPSARMAIVDTNLCVDCAALVETQGR